MSMPRGLQFVALANMDRLMLKSMLGLLERHLSCAWVETALAPSLLIADADLPAGLSALEHARQQGLVTVAVSHRTNPPWTHLLKRPFQTRELLIALNAADSVLREAQRAAEQERALRGGSAPPPPTPDESQLLRRAGNLFDYLVRPGSRTIVEVRFAAGKSVMFNHPCGEYCSALSMSQLLGLGTHAVQETAHGSGQAGAEWNIARRVLGPRQLEELTWQITLRCSEGKPLPNLPKQGSYKLSRLPRLLEALSARQLSMAKLLTRSASDIPAIARACGAEPREIVDFLNAAWACGLLLGQTDSVLRAPLSGAGIGWGTPLSR